MADPTSPAGIRQYRQDLSKQALRECRQFLHGVGNYFLKTLPSNIDDSYVQEVESLLLDVANKAFYEGWPQLSHINLCLANAAQLADIVKRGTGGGRGVDFFNTARMLGQLLVSI